MSKKNKALLSDLMKKQISEKATKKTKQTNVKATNSSESADEDSDQEVEQGEEKSEEELLEEAKKESSAKAAQYYSLEFIKKMIVENLIKYISMIAILLVAAMAVIKIGPSLMAFLRDLIHNMIMAGFSV
jgi:Fe2+ transport system protein B